MASKDTVATAFLTVGREMTGD